MIQSRGWRALGAASLGFIFVACAGGDTPATDAAFEAQIAERYANGAVASAGGSGGAAGGRGGAGGRAGSGGRGGQAGTNGRGGSSADPGECDGFAILAQKCGGPGCHGADSQYSNFAEDEDAALAYVGESGEALCASEGPLINPGNPAASIIIQKVTADEPPCGDPMPVVGELSQSEITCLQEWIGSLDSR